MFYGIDQRARDGEELELDPDVAEQTVGSRGADDLERQREIDRDVLDEHLRRRRERVDDGRERSHGDVGAAGVVREDRDLELLRHGRVGGGQIEIGVLVTLELGVDRVEPVILDFVGRVDDRHGLVRHRRRPGGPAGFGGPRDRAGVERAEQEVPDEVPGHEELDVEPRGHPGLIDHRACLPVRCRPVYVGRSRRTYSVGHAAPIPHRGNSRPERRRRARISRTRSGRFRGRTCDPGAVSARPRVRRPVHRLRPARAPYAAIPRRLPT